LTFTVDLRSTQGDAISRTAHLARTNYIFKIFG
jgi:hypothetical protein